MKTLHPSIYTESSRGLLVAGLKQLPRILSTFACCGTLAFTTTHRASEDGVQGGEIHGTEQLPSDLVFVATADAPAGATAGGSFEAVDHTGTSGAI